MSKRTGKRMQGYLFSVKVVGGLRYKRQKEEGRASKMILILKNIGMYTEVCQGYIRLPACLGKNLDSAAQVLIMSITIRMATSTL